MDAHGGHAPPGAVYDSCTESEPPGSKDNSLRGGGAFPRNGGSRRSSEGSLRAWGAYPASARRSREGSLRAGRAFGRRDGGDCAAVTEEERVGRRPTPRSRSFGALLAEAAAVLRGAAHGGFSVGSPPQQGPPALEPYAGPSPRGAPARVELQPRAARTADAASPRAVRAADAVGSPKAHAQPGVTPPQAAGGPTRDLSSPRSTEVFLAHPPGITQHPARREAAPALGLGLGIPGSATASEALSTAGTSASRMTSLASVASMSEQSDPAATAGGAPGAWPLAAPGSAGLLVRLSAEPAAAPDAQPAHWQQVCLRSALFLSGVNGGSLALVT